MVEATMGTVLLLFAALIVIQFVLVFHGRMAAYGAALRSARSFAITGSFAHAQTTFNHQVSASLGALDWEELSCSRQSGVGTCTVTVHVPIVIPGGTLIIRPYTKTGVYPIGSESGV